MLSAFFHPYGWGYSKKTGLARQNCRCGCWQKSDENIFVMKIQTGIFSSLRINR